MTGNAAAPYSGFDLMPIAGHRRRGRGGHPGADVSPWNGEVLTEIEQASADDLDQAFEAARQAQREWAAQPPAARADVMRAAISVIEARKDEITGWLEREAGSTVAKAALEWGLARSVTIEAASIPHHVQGRIVPSDLPGKENLVFRVPAGVVAVISPWNFPLRLSIRSVAPALAAGNAVVLKPASDTPVTGGTLLATIYEEAGLPAGLLSVIVGSGGEIGGALVRHAAPSVVSFTGSTEVGTGIAKSAGIKKLSLELGGNAPLVVLDDADLDVAVPAALFGSFFHQGQICMRANRIIVDEACYEPFVQRFADGARALTLGDANTTDADIGPVVNERQRDQVLDKISRAREQGAEQVLGGEPAGLIVPPHVLLGTNDVATVREEVFGPAITVIRARGEKDTLEIANDTEYGLSGAVFTRDVDRGVPFARRIAAGMTHVNDSPVHDDANTAFGGGKASGIGRFGGPWAVREFTIEHWISVQRQPRQYPISIGEGGGT